MRYFFDTEFIEYPPLHAKKGTIDLISIGIVDEHGHEYYAISSEFNQECASEWVVDNVINKLESDINRKSLDMIKKEIIEFIGNDKNPKFYAYFCSYDWVAFCWIFGTMVDLPNNFEMYCHDIKHMMSMFGLSKDEILAQDSGHHNALADARWNMTAFRTLQWKAAQLGIDKKISL